MTDERIIRAFLALDPPEEILREIGRVQDRLRKQIHGDVRWVRPEAIHLTLKFFGDIPERDLANISAVVGKAAAGVMPFDLTIGGVGVFPDRYRQPRVIWLGMGGEAARLVTFQQGMERALQGIGFPREERPFMPHLTLGRVLTPKGLTGLKGVLEKGEMSTAGRFTASGLCLFKSDLTPRGAIYTRLAEYPFAGREGA
jgi:RNA 2',3'-cyclic 3'-phosphodiesterase